MWQNILVCQSNTDNPKTIPGLLLWPDSIFAVLVDYGPYVYEQLQAGRPYGLHWNHSLQLVKS